MSEFKYNAFEKCRVKKLRNAVEVSQLLFPYRYVFPHYPKVHIFVSSKLTADLK